jgi:predicted ester cyclase
MNTDNETLVRQFYAVFNTGNINFLDQVLSPDWIEYPLSVPDQAPGRDGFKPIVESFCTVFPDIQFVNEDIIAAGDKFTVRSLVTATHSGRFLGIESTGRRVQFNTIDIHRIANGQIVETWHIEDFYGLLQQLKAPEE